MFTALTLVFVAVVCATALALVLLAELVATEVELETGFFVDVEVLGRAVVEEDTFVEEVLGFATVVLVAGLLEAELVLTFVLLTGVVVLGFTVLL